MIQRGRVKQEQQVESTQHSTHRPPVILVDLSLYVISIPFKKKNEEKKVLLFFVALEKINFLRISSKDYGYLEKRKILIKCI